MVGQLNEAETLYRKTLQIQPNLPLAYFGLGTIQLLQGQLEEARSSFAKWVELSGLGDSDRLFGTAIVEHTAGNAQASKTAADEFDRRFGVEDPSSSAEIRAWRAEADSAFAWLDKALVARDPGLTGIKHDVLLASLHADPRWNALLKKVGLPAD